MKYLCISRKVCLFAGKAGLISPSNRCIEEPNIVLSVRLYRVYFSLFLSGRVKVRNIDGGENYLTDFNPTFANKQLTESLPTLQGVPKTGSINGMCQIIKWKKIDTH